MKPNNDSLPTAQEKAERVERALSGIPYARHLGVCLCRSNQPDIVLHLPFRQPLVGNTDLSAFHGGVVATFMQMTALVTTFAELGEKRLPRLIDFSIDFLSSAGPRDLFARCKFHRVGKRVAAVEIRCWQADENSPVAVARAHLNVAQSASEPPVVIASDLRANP